MGNFNDMLFVKQNAHQPIFTLQLFEPDGVTPLDISDATAVKFRMQSTRGGSLKIANASMQIANPTAGMLEYHWAGTDTDTIDRYLVEVEIDYASGGPLIMPPVGYYQVVVGPTLPRS